MAQDSPASLATTRRTQVIVTITEPSRRYVGGLNKDQVTMLDNGKPQEMLTMAESTFPVSIGLLFNVSRNRRRETLALTRKMILRFFDVPEKTNEYSIMGFNENSLLVTDWTREPKELISDFDKLENMKPSNNLTAYDALEVGIKKMGDARYSKRAVILISDLNDPGSKSKQDQVIETLRRIDILVYTIIIDTSLFPRSMGSALDRICSVSGGFAKDASNTAEFLDLMEIISLELRHQYLISFIPRGAEGEWHRLNFEAKPLMVRPSPSKKLEKVPLFIRSREGYYLNR